MYTESNRMHPSPVVVVANKEKGLGTNHQVSTMSNNNPSVYTYIVVVLAVVNGLLKRGGQLSAMLDSLDCDRYHHIVGCRSVPPVSLLGKNREQESAASIHSYTQRESLSGMVRWLLTRRIPRYQLNNNNPWIARAPLHSTLDVEQKLASPLEQEEASDSYKRKCQ